MIKPVIAGLAAGLLLVGCAAVAGKVAQPGHDFPEASPYAVSENAMADVDAALTRASVNDKRVLLVMGGNWCHDSRALAGWLETPRFGTLLAAHYELVFVNVGMPQTGDGHNLGVAQRFGLTDLPGTPALLVLTARGELVNTDTAQSWRNAASRSESAIFDELAMLAEAPLPSTP